MGKLDDLWFDVLFKDSTDKGIADLRKKFDTLGADIGKSVSDKINDKLKNITFNTGATLQLRADKDILRKSVDDALKGYRTTVNVTANTTTNAANAGTQSAIQDEKLRQAMLRTQREAEQLRLAQQRLATETERTNAANARAQRAMIQTERAMGRQARAARTATTANRQFGQSLNYSGGGVGVLQRMTQAAQTFGLVFTGGALLSSLIRIRGEFDMQRISLEAILQSGEQAERLYNRLQSLSVISPFQFGDLVKYAKQLSAYQIPTTDLYDTTKRLADLSAGLGVDMNRIILAYGQVRSAAVLRGTELRQFTEAGIPMVQNLADKFSELEGRVVTTAEVFDKISGREVPFKMVKKVIEELTEEGGKFYMMQEKQAESLKGKVSNLADAYAIMMNKIGESTDGLLKGGVDTLTSLMLNYNKFAHVLVMVASAYGAYKASQLVIMAVQGKGLTQSARQILIEKQKQAMVLQSAANYRALSVTEKYLIVTRNRLTTADMQLLRSQGLLNEAQLRSLFYQGKINAATFTTMATQMNFNTATIRSIANLNGFQKALRLVGLGFANLGRQMKAFVAGNWVMILIGVVTELIYAWSTAGEAFEEATNEMKESMREAASELAKFAKDYQGAISSIASGDATTEEIEKTIDAIVEKITSIAPDQEMAIKLKLEGIDDMQKRGAEAVKMLQATQDAVAHLNATPIELTWTEDILWGGLGEGVEEDTQDYIETLQILQNYTRLAAMDIAKSYAYFNKEMGRADSALREDYEEMLKEVKKSTKSIKKILADLPADASEETRKMVASMSIDKMLAQMTDLGERGKLILRIEMDKELFGESATAINAIYEKMSLKNRRAIEAMSGDMTDANVELIKQFVKETAMVYPELMSEAERLCADINKLEAFIKINFAYESNYNTTQDYIIQKLSPTKADYQRMANEYSDVLSLIADATSIVDAGDIIQKKIDEIDELARQHGKSTDEATKALLASNAKSRERLVDALKAIDYQPKVKTSKSGQSGDAITEAAKARYELIKSAIDEWGKLAKVMDKEKALEDLLKLPGFKDLFSEDEIKDYFTDNGAIDLVADFIKKMESRSTKQARQFVDALRKEMQKLQVNDITDGVKRAIESINSNLQNSIELYKQYEQILGKTGRKDFALLATYGRSDAEPKNEATQRKDAVTEIAQKVGEQRSVEVLLTLNEEELNKLPEELKKAINEAKTAIESDEKDLISKVTDAIVNTMTVEDNIKRIETSRDELLTRLKDAYNSGAIDEAVYNEGITSVTVDAQRQIGKLREELLKLLPVWNEIFGDTAKKGYGDLMKARGYAQQLVANAQVQTDPKTGKPTGALTSYVDESGEVHENIFMTISDIEKLIKAIDDLYDGAAQKNPFKALVDAIKDLKDGKYTAKDIKNIANSIAGIGDIASEVANSFSGMMSALGDEAAADNLSMIGEAASGIANVAGKIGSGDYVGAAVSGLTTTVGLITSIFQLHDKKLQRLIEESQLRVKELQATRDEITRAIERSLGEAYTLNIDKYVAEDKKRLAELEKILSVQRNVFGRANANNLSEYETISKRLANYNKATSGGETIGVAYMYQRDMYEQELTELRKQRAAEEDKKDSDAGAIADYDAEISELEDTILHFAEDTLAELLSIDLKDWAGQIGDSLVDAFLAGEDAAEAFDKTVADLMKNGVKEMASVYILEPMFEKLRTYLFGEDGLSGAFGSDYYLSQSELGGMQKYIDEIKDNGLPAVESLVNAVDGAFGGLLSTTEEASGLSAGIQGNTEDQANLLASYINAMRADLSVLRALKESSTPEVKLMVEAQLQQLQAIAENTRRNAEAAAQILSAINSVTASTSNGKAIRIY